MHQHNQPLTRINAERQLTIMRDIIATQELFPTHPPLPPGFRHVPDFLSEAEENRLLRSISKFDLHPMIFQGFEAKRKVISFGYDYSFDRRILTKGKPIPPDFQWLLDKTAAQLKIDNDFAELLITEYPPGAVINWHRDAPPFDVIAGISLLGECIFRFRPFDKKKQNRKSIISLPLPTRSLYLMQGESREEWQHSILPVNTTRYSVTLRTLRGV
ncbi:MAG TPA: alpha-ketoglutarate-dependent dioxygenase AlkB [Chitinophagaceae bacterium]|nr:alpha-ketoglutarate-dependent dioxygenase AlkB [Chitinophagaceae bacterium]